MIFGIFAVTVGIIIGLFVQPTYSGDTIYTQFNKFRTVFNTAFRNYVDELDSEKMMEDAIKGMLQELDVHSVYIDKEKMKKVEEDFQGHFHGIGIQFDYLEDSITVISPLAGGPSAALGIQAGDKIVMIDDSNAVGIERSDIPKRLKGPKGTLVTVDIYREGEKELLHFDIIRDVIPNESLNAKYMIENTDIGYVSFGRFSATTHDEFMKAIRELNSRGMEKLILDLRGNPGGYLTQAFKIANEFLPRGDTIVYTKGRLEQNNQFFKADGQGRLTDIPVIVMINGGSASASEIVSGAIQDRDRGLVVGRTSYGKGLVQRQYPLEDGSAFRITISYYYTPSGRSIQRPFKDKDKYRSLFGRLELEEGANLDQAIENIKHKLRDSAHVAEEINLDSLPLFHTRSGRTVLGGGGITPDYIIMPDTSKLQDLTVQFRRKRLFTIFADHYLKEGGKFIKDKYEDDFASFYKDFKLNDGAWESFKELAESKEIEWNQEEFEIDKDFIELSISADISNIVWDRYNQIQFYHKIDRQLLRAIKLFPEAEKISNL